MTLKSQINVNSVKNLFSNAVDDNEISQDAANIMINSLNDTNILGCTGTSVDDLETDSVTLVSLIVDDSGSMSPNEAVVRESYDQMTQALKDSKQHGSMLVSGRTFSTDQKILYGFKKVDEIDKIGGQYKANGNSTRLYDAAVDALTGIRAYAKQLNDSGIQTKCITVIFSDGQDNDSQSFKDPSKVKKVADDCNRSEMFYLVFVGFKGNPSDDFESVAKSIGFPNILTSANTPSEIRKSMGLVSQSIIRKSQTQIGPSSSFFS